MPATTDCSDTTSRLRALMRAYRTFEEAASAPKEIAHAVVRSAVEHVGDCAWLNLPSEDGRVLAPVTVFHRASEEQGFFEDLIAEARVLHDETPSALAFLHGKTTLVPEVAPAEFARHFPERFRERLIGLRPASIIVVPVRSHDLSIGVLGVISFGSDGRRFDGDDVEFVEALADQAALVLNNARAHELRRQELAARQRAEESLRVMKARIEALLAHSNEGLSLLDAEGRAIYRSPASIRMLGLEGDEVDTLPLALIHPDDRAVALSHLRDLLANPGGKVNFEARIFHRPRGYRWISLTITNRLDDPSIRALVSNAVDVTEARATRIELEDFAARFREMAETIREVFWLVTRPSGELLYVSPAYETIWGRSSESLYASPSDWFAGIHPDDRERVLEAMAKQEEGTYDETYRIVRPDGSLRWIRDRAFPVRDARGAVVRMAGVSEDVTDRRELETRFLQAQKLEAVGRLAGGVAHDFNNILGVILGHSELLLGDLHPSEPMYQDLEEIKAAAERASTLTRQLLVFSRQQVLAPRVVDLGVVLASMERLLRRVLREDVTLVMNLAEELWHCRVDPGQMEQVIMNLAVNARDAMPDGGTLTVETRNVAADDPALVAQQPSTPGDHVMMLVRDTGVGMSDEVMAHIFDPFFTTKPTGRGTGLGLATVFGIVQQSGGVVWAESEPGHGTTFRVCLPRTQDPRSADSSDAIRPVIVRGHETVLLVEDEAPVRALVRSVLCRNGYNVIDAANAGEALLLCERHAGEIHLMLTDVVMPHMSGLQLAQRLAPLRPRMRVLLMSGYTADESLLHRDGASSVRFIAKPFTSHALLRAVRDALKAR